MDKPSLLKVFEKLGFPIISDPDMGELVEMNPKDAYVFSSIVGSPYLIYPYGITMKGRCEVFIHRALFSSGYYVYSPGLFSRDKQGKLKEGDSADNLLQKYPSVFTGKKYLYIHDIGISSLSNVENYVYDLLKSKNKKTEDFLLYKNFLSGSSAEPFYEYLASIHFNSKGYITENQVPWFQQNLKYNEQILQGGIPDFSAFHCSLSPYLQSLGIIEKNKGIPVNLIPVIKNFQEIKSTFEFGKKTNIYEFIIGEVKSSKSSMVGALFQLRKYREVNLANKLFTIIPDVENNREENIGEIYISNYGLQINDAITLLTIDNERQSIDDQWTSTYLKILLMGNMAFNNVINFIEIHRKNNGLELLKEYEATHLIDAVDSTTHEDFAMFFSQNI